MQIFHLDFCCDESETIAFQKYRPNSTAYNKRTSIIIFGSEVAQMYDDDDSPCLYESSL